VDVAGGVQRAGDVGGRDDYDRDGVEGRVAPLLVPEL
jgi:hypothetical protein